IELKTTERAEALATAERAHDQLLHLNGQLQGKKGYKEHEKLKTDAASARVALLGERAKAEAVVLRLQQVAQYVGFLEMASEAKPLGELAGALKQALSQTGLSNRVCLTDLEYVKGLAEVPSVKDWEALRANAKPVETPFFRARTALAGEERHLLALHA